MSNPFTFTNAPQAKLTALQAQNNANHTYFDLMGARDRLAEYDAAKAQAPCEVIADVHTLTWVFKEHTRIAQKIRAAEKQAARVAA